MTRLVQAQRSINLRPKSWEQFKRKCGAEGISPAARLGELVEGDLKAVPSSVWLTADLSNGERRAIWYALEFVVRKMPLGEREALVYQQATMQLRDRFADAFDPPKPTMLDPGVPAIRDERVTS